MTTHTLQHDPAALSLPRWLIAGFISGALAVLIFVQSALAKTSDDARAGDCARGAGESQPEADVRRARWTTCSEVAPHRNPPARDADVMTLALNFGSSQEPHL